MLEFKAWPKISRGNPFEVTISEKIDGTNACIIIKDNEIVGVQSRKRFINILSDNYRFAQWVSDNTEDLLKLGEGYHYGEWAGLGIQGNPLKLVRKHFFLFNTFRWKDKEDRPDCCDVVPILFEGIMDNTTVDTLLEGLRQNTEIEHEGLVVYYHCLSRYSKHTLKSVDGKWVNIRKEK